MNRGDPRLSSPLPTAPHFYDGTFLLGRNLPSQFHRHVLEIDHIISRDATLRALSVTSKRLAFAATLVAACAVCGSVR
jgi:hypothetical protein